MMKKKSMDDFLRAYVKINYKNFQKQIKGNFFNCILKYF